MKCPVRERAFESGEQARLARRAAAAVLHAPVATWAELGPYGVLLRIPPYELTEAALPVELWLLRRDRRGVPRPAGGGGRRRSAARIDR
jgi:hypothetical protein